jgi:4-amino-4-deoxy-L-arabinose transferase-like glycosyltransferase
MNCLRVIAAFAMLCVGAVTSASAFTGDVYSNPASLETARPAERIRDAFVVAQAASAPAATQNTITTTAPVSSETTISVGTLAGQVLTWLAAAFAVPIGTLLTLWLKRLFTLAGVQVTTQMRDQLQQIVVNGLNAAAKNATTQLAGKAPIEIKNQLVADAVKYTQAHGADTIKALGLDPQSGEAVQAIKARIETAIADPKAPTPAVLTPPKAA